MGVYYIQYSDGREALRYGPFSVKRRAEQAMKELRERGFEPVLVPDDQADARVLRGADPIVTDRQGFDVSVDEDIAQFQAILDGIRSPEAAEESREDTREQLYLIVALRDGLLAEIAATDRLEEALRERDRLDRLMGIQREPDGSYASSGQDVVGLLVARPEDMRPHLLRWSALRGAPEIIQAP